jgi:hypothetical protein
LATVDGRGLAVSYLGVRIPWHHVTAVAVERTRPAVRVTFKIDDPGAVLALATAPTGRHRQLR